MAKKLIDRKYMTNLDINGLTEFVVEPDFILTPYAKDILLEKQIPIIYSKAIKINRKADIQVSNQDEIKEKIVKLLVLEYNISPTEIPDIVKKVLIKISER